MVKYDSKVVRLNSDTIEKLEIYRAELSKYANHPVVSDAVMHESYDKLISGLVIDKLNRDFGYVFSNTRS